MEYTVVSAGKGKIPASEGYKSEQEPQDYFILRKTEDKLIKPESPVGKLLRMMRGAQSLRALPILHE